MSNEIQRYREPLTATKIKAQVQLIQGVMKAVMEKGVHYGVIPGTPKPTLYKPGSEKLLSTFHIGVDPSGDSITDLSTPDEIRYRVAARGFDQGTGELLGVGIGECSSNEEKYKWRKPVCDEEFNETPEDQKRIVWKKYQDKPYQQKQVRMKPSDVANTILKMAKKRAQIDLTLTVTAASDIFDQDLEDMDETTRESVVNGKEKKEPIKEPQKKADVEVKNPDDPSTAPQHKAIHALLGKLGITDDLAKHERVSRMIGAKETITSFSALTKGIASKIIDFLNKELEEKKAQ